MRPSTIILFLLLTNTSLFGQTKYHINYDKSTKLRINSETKIGKENFYDVDFLNANNKVIKSIEKVAEENHSTKKGFDVQNTITYYFYTDTLELYSISTDIIQRVIFKTIYEYRKGKQIGWESFSLKPRISKDSFNSIIDKDIFLNHPNIFPVNGLTLETKMVRKFENDKLIYKCYYERYGKLKTALPAREQFFKYNDKGQIIEHISNPKSDAGGTAFLRQTFEYNSNNQLIKREWYENGKHQCTDEFEYVDKIITESQKFYDIYGDGDPKKLSTMTIIFKLEDDGLYYSDNTFKTKFRICSDLE